LSRRNFAGDPLGDQKTYVEHLIRKTSDALDGLRGVGINAVDNFEDTSQFGTGYNGTETTMSFIFGLSVFGGEDVMRE
jgi:hypothetical protein